MDAATVSPNQALWEKGDFTRIAATMRESGAALVQRIGIAGGLRVLDLGCGDGTTALPAARTGAEVLGVDIARNLVEAGNRRAAELGLANCRFQQGDATNLKPIPDQTFDVVVSIFGAMFAPKPFDVAKEMVRVTRPGGRIVMGNWIPNDPTLVAQILRISSAYTPPPPEGFVSPMTWGVESHVVERFAGAGIPVEKITDLLEHSRDPVSLDMPVGSDEEAPLGDFIEDAEAMSAENAVISELLHTDIRHVLATLDEREQQVIRLRFGLDDGQPRTLDQIGKLFGLSRERVRQIEREVMAKLRNGERADRLRSYAS